MGRSHGAIGLENVRIRRPHEHGSAGGLESFHSGDRIQKVADSGTRSAGFVWMEGRSDNISFRITAIQVPCGRALKIHQVLFSQAAQISHREVSCF